MEREKANERQINYWFHHERQSAAEYITEMNNGIKLLTKDYKYYFYSQPIKIEKAISEIVKQALKRPYYKRRIVIYYYKDAVYTVFYKAHKIDVEMFILEQAGSKLAHIIAKENSKKND